MKFQQDNETRHGEQRSLPDFPVSRPTMMTAFAFGAILLGLLLFGTDRLFSWVPQPARSSMPAVVILVTLVLPRAYSEWRQGARPNVLDVAEWAVLHRRYGLAMLLLVESRCGSPARTHQIVTLMQQISTACPTWELELQKERVARARELWIQIVVATSISVAGLLLWSVMR